MSDLISRSEVIKLVNQFVFGLCKEQNDEARRTFNKYIEKMPTAYDIDKVVEKLKTIKDGYDRSCIDNAYQRGVQDGAKWMKKNAIEIVKQGGVSDDFCEWKMDNVGASIGCRSDLHYTGYVNRTYCPYCGKKIKVVE